MKLIFGLSLVAIISILLSSSSFGQDLAITGGVELSLPLGDFSDGASTGFGLNANGLYPFTDNIVGVGTLSFNRFGGKTNGSTLLGGDIKSSFSIVGIKAGARYYIDYALEGIFINGGIGLHPTTVKVEYTNVDPIYASFLRDAKSSSTEFGFNIGGGYTTDQLDATLNLQVITGDGNSLSFLNLGLAYRFM